MIANESAKNESQEHKMAKELVHKAVLAYLSGQSIMPSIKRKCSVCNCLGDEESLFDGVSDSILEYRTKSGHYVDVALMNKNEILSAIEIKITSAVNFNKSEKMALPFIEFDGNEILNNPENWIGINNNLAPLVCKKCKNNLLQFTSLIKNVANDLKIVLPVGTYYRYGIHKCWKCDKEIMVYAWPTDALWDNNEPKIKPLPPTIKYLEKAGYWANVCPGCDSLQGDFFLKAEHDSVLFYASCDNDSTESFENDMLGIAYGASLNGMI